MRTLTVTLEDLEGIPHGTLAAGTTLSVTARYSREVILTSGSIIPPAIKPADISGAGVAAFEVFESDSTLVQEDYRDFAILVEATVTDGARKGVTFRRTVKVLTTTPPVGEPIPLGTLPGTQGLPAKWTSIGDLMDELTTTVATELNDPGSAAHQAVVDASAGVAVDAVEGELADPQSPSRQSIETAAATTLTTELADENSNAYAAVVDAAATTTDPAIAANISTTGTDTRQALDADYSAGVTVTATGSTGADGGALDAALSASATFGVPAVLKGDFHLSASVTVPAGAVIRGEQATITQTGTTRFPALLVQENTSIHGLRLVGVPSMYVNSSTVYTASAMSVSGTGVRITECIMEGFAGAGINAAAGSDVTIHGCTISGPGDTYIVTTDPGFSAGVRVLTNSRLSVQDCDISGYAQGIVAGYPASEYRIIGNRIHDIPGQHGMYLQQVERGVIANNIVWNVALQGIKLQLGGTEGVDSSEVTITGNVIQSSGSHGILLTNTGSGSPLRVRNTAISGNVVTDPGGDGIAIMQADDCTVIGNVVTGAGGRSIRMEVVSGVLVAFNRLSGSNGTGIFITHADDWEFSGNRIADVALSNTTGDNYGIHVAGGSTAPITRGSIRDNSITVNTTPTVRRGINLAGDGVDQGSIRITGNQSRGCTDFGFYGISGAPVGAWYGNDFEGGIRAVATLPTNVTAWTDLGSAPTAADFNNLLDDLRRVGAID